MLTRQRHPAVPTSNAPPIPEWADHYWYMLRAAALQAHASLSDEDAAKLVQFFESLSVTTPCQECRGHFVTDWAADPYTIARHARNMEQSVAWVEALRAKVDARVQEAKAAAAAAKPKSALAMLNRLAPGRGQQQLLRNLIAPAAAATPAPAPAAPAAPAPAAPAAQAPAVVVEATRRVGPAVSRRGPRAAAGRAPVATPANRDLAVRSAVILSRANRQGIRPGCNCGRR